MYPYDWFCVPGSHILWMWVVWMKAQILTGSSRSSGCYCFSNAVNLYICNSVIELCVCRSGCGSGVSASGAARSRALQTLEADGGGSSAAGEERSAGGAADRQTLILHQHRPQHPHVQLGSGATRRSCEICCKEPPSTHTHTHTLVSMFHRVHYIGVMVFLLYKLYFLSPYPNPKPTPHKTFCIFTFSKKILWIICSMNYKLFSSWAPKTISPQGQKILVWLSLWECRENQVHTHTHTHTFVFVNCGDIS